MSDLDQLLAQARSAEPDVRIQLRDAIAAHGEAAIEAMTEWIDDPTLGAFAIRVLHRLAGDSSFRPSVVQVLRAVDRDELASFLNRDLDDVLRAIDPAPA